MTDSPPTPADWARIARHLAGDESPAEGRDTAAWIREDPAREAAAASARRVWAITGDLAAAARAQHDVRAAQTDAGWRRMQARMVASGPSTPRIAAHAVPVRPLRRWWRTATVSAALAAAGLAIVVGLDAAGAQHKVYTAPMGERVTVFLPDGTRADLHPGSRMDVVLASRMAVLRRRLGLAADASRRVALVGEAVFAVRHDGDRPFLVEAGGMVAEDIGTVFAVRAYPGDAIVRIAVSDGEVAVRSTAAPAGSGSVRLVRGQVADVNRVGDISVRSGEDGEADFGWTRGRLVFRRERVADVAVALTRWFGRPVVVADRALGERRITLDQPITTLEAATTAVAAAIGAAHALRGDTVRITRP